MSKQDPYSRDNIVAAINLLGKDWSAAEKRAVLKSMTDNVEQLRAEAREFGVDDLEREVADRERDEWEGLADSPY